jgi:hypothetical protein
MIELRPSVIELSVKAQGYEWYSDRPNIVGIRTNVNAPNVFNDILCVVWKQPIMPTLSILEKQEWLNSWGFIGKNGKTLKEDGIDGENTQFAVNLYEKVKGSFVMRNFSVTTDPGTFYLNHPVNPLGTAILVPGQYVNSHALGFHKQRQDHPALVQVGNLTVYRDTDLDDEADTAGMKKYTGNNFGINIHRSNTNGSTPSVGKWSAGCQVFQNFYDHKFLLRICENYKAFTHNRFTYTLLLENQLTDTSQPMLCPTCGKPL